MSVVVVAGGARWAAAANTAHIAGRGEGRGEENRPKSRAREERRRDTTPRNIADVPHFGDIVGHDPYPWQRRLDAALLDADVPDAIDIPTGLGKTACVLLLLLARLHNRGLPTRIVYVVDRRAIVAQTADAVRCWIERIAALPALARAFDACAAFAAERPVGLGVLRGGLADDGAWRLDPARPAVVVGTVDMVGSRLLFAGYGDGRSKRPMHAGLLAHDAIVVLDEAHLSPAMDALLGAMAGLHDGAGLRTLRLSATRLPTGAVMGLTAADDKSAAVRRRLHARKRVRFMRAGTPRDRIAKICHAACAHRTGPIAVFVERVADAARIASRLDRELGPHGAGRVALLTGTLRASERAALAGGAVWAHFGPGRDRRDAAPSVYLVMTAAGEVGVDLDAAHAVMDLATLDSMIQRIGRVNRAGAGDATITVVFTEPDAEAAKRAPKTFRDRRDAARRETLSVLRDLADVSPATLHALDEDTLARCTVASVRPARLDAAVVEAFAATSAALPLPPVAVYLRGVAETSEAPETFLAWRRDVPALAALGASAARAVLSFYRPRAEELARVPTPFARTLIRTRAWPTRHGVSGLRSHCRSRSSTPWPPPAPGTTAARRARCGSAQPACPRGDPRLRSRRAARSAPSGWAATATSSARSPTPRVRSPTRRRTATSSCTSSPRTTAGRARRSPAARSGTPRTARARTRRARCGPPTASRACRHATGRGGSRGSNRS